MSKLQKIIREAILEVLAEDDQDNIKGTVNISSDDPDEQDKVQQAQQNKQSYSLYEDKELAEMARIATLIKVGDDEKINAAKEKYNGTWVGDLIDAVINTPEGITQPALALAAGKTRQQDINPYVRKFLQDGTFTFGNLEKPKLEKPESTGILGRPQSPEGAKRAASKDLMQKLKDNPSYEPSEDEIKVIGKDDVAKIITLMASGGVKRGRKIGGSTKLSELIDLDEMARTSTVYKIGDVSKLEDLDPKLQSSKWVTGIIDFLDEKGSAGIAQIAKEKFDRPQQSINQLVQALVRQGVIQPVEDRDNRKTFAQKQNTYYNEEIPDEFSDEIDPDDNTDLSAEDYLIGNKFANKKPKVVEPDEEDSDGEPIIPNIPKDGPVHKPNISDDDYKDLMKYLDYKERIKKIDSDLRKTNSKKSVKKSDVTDLGGYDSSDENSRLSKLKTSYEDKLSTLKQTSQYIKSKLNKENGVAPEVDVEDEDDDQMVAESKNRMQKLANIIHG